jgi:hypothetical protein
MDLSPQLLCVAESSTKPEGLSSVRLLDLGRNLSFPLAHLWSAPVTTPMALSTSFSNDYSSVTPCTLRPEVATLSDCNHVWFDLVHPEGLTM